MSGLVQGGISGRGRRLFPGTRGEGSKVDGQVVLGGGIPVYMSLLRLL